MSTELAVPVSPLPERMEYSRILAESNIIPDAFKRQPADILVAIEYGRALGIEPIVALREINVIKGTPALSALMMAALARKAGHTVRITGTDTEATCTIIRHDDPGFEHVAKWDEKKGRDAGLWGRGHWAKDSGTMLKWRAIAECVRFACPEVLGGLKYSVDEVRDFGPTKHTVTQITEDAPAAPSKAGGSGVAGLKARLVEADQDDPEPEPEPATTAVVVTAADIAAINNLDDLRDLAAVVPMVGEMKELFAARATELKAAAEKAADDRWAGAPDDVDATTGEVIDAEVVES